MPCPFSSPASESQTLSAHHGEDAGDPAWSTSSSATPCHAVLGCFSLCAIQVWPACPTTCHQPSWGLGLSHHLSASCTGSESGSDSSMEPFFPRRHLFPSPHRSQSPRQRFPKLHVSIYALPVSLSPFYASSSTSSPVPHRAKSRPAVVMGTSATSTQLGARGTFWGCRTVG